jgi:Fucosyltransferase, N-terminal
LYFQNTFSGVFCFVFSKYFLKVFCPSLNITMQDVMCFLAIADECDSMLESPLPFQIWIVRHHESPRGQQVNPSVLGDLVNWTMNYRRDSTIPLPYNYVKPRLKRTGNSVAYGSTAITSESALVKLISKAAGKNKKVAWVASNCRNTLNGRKNYVLELSK